MRFVAETADLRQALSAVLPHVHPDKSYGRLHRVRIDVGPVNATVQATSTMTVAIAIASVLDNEDDELGPIDLSPTDARAILQLFPGKHTSEDEQSQTVRLETTAEYLEVTDISGMFPGKSLKLPVQQTDDQFPDLTDTMAARMAITADPTRRVCLSGAALALFTHASKVYGHPLIVEPNGEDAALLIHCGESFLGLLPPRREDVDERALHDAWRKAWFRRLDIDPFDVPSVDD